MVALVASLASGGGCGSRTSLEAPGAATAGGGSGGGDDPGTGGASVGEGGGSVGEGGGSVGAGGGSPSGCPRPGVPAQLVLEEHVFDMGNVATNGCSFAATWLGHEPGAVVVQATTFRVVDDAWQAATITTLGRAGQSLNAPRIAWDGGAYVVAWVDGVLHLQRIAEDGEPLGPRSTSFDAPGNVFVRWLQAEADGSLRVGFVSPGGTDGYDVNVARVTSDGGVVDAPRALTATGVADVVGFVGAPGASAALWTAPVSGEMTLVRALFDDAGDLLAAPETLLVNRNLLSSHQGVAVAGGETYVGVLRNDPPGLAIGRLAQEGQVPIEGVPGGDVPVLAATGRGALGVVTRREHGVPTSPLELTILAGDAVASTEVLGEAWGSYGYGMAGSDDTFGILWANSDSSVTFATVGP